MQQTNMRTSLEFINLYCPLEFVIDLAICKTLGEEKKKKTSRHHDLSSQSGIKPLTAAAIVRLKDMV